MLANTKATPSGTPGQYNVTTNLSMAGPWKFMVTFFGGETEFAMRPMKLPVLLLLICVSASLAQGQSVSNPDTERINLLIGQVHSRVNDAAQAATYVLNADRHRQTAERMVAAGEREEARAE